VLHFGEEIVKRLLVVVAFAGLAGCADKPEDIAAAYIPDSAYASLTCHELGQEELREGDVLSAVSGKQRRAHKTDSWSVLAAGLPLSELTGSDVAEQVSREKGKMDAIHRVEISKKCPGSHIN